MSTLSSDRMSIPPSQWRKSRAITGLRDVERARALALRFGWNAMAYQVVNEGILHWFSDSCDAMVGYVRTHGVCIVVGAPICDGSRLRDVLVEWERFVQESGARACYFGAAGRLFDILHGRSGYTTVLLGAQPTWNPERWHEIPARVASLRSQISRTRNKQVRVTEFTPERAMADPRLRTCLEQWLRARALPTLHFLVEPHTLHDLTGRRIFVAERGSSVVGFINASPVPARSGWLVEQFVRGDGAPNGTIELLLDAMMHAVARDGAAYVTMGLVPLRAGTHLRPDENPAWLSVLFAATRVHGRRFYNFDGLERFKTKFRPDAWEPIYAISAEARFSVRTLYAIAAAFTVQSPLTALAGGLARALRTEARRLGRWLDRRLGRSDGVGTAELRAP